MATSEDLAKAYQRAQAQRATAATRAAVAQFNTLNEHALTESWAAGVGQSIEATITAAQLAAASAAAPYVAGLAEAQGGIPAPSLLAAGALAGIASDGRPLRSLLFLPILLVKRLIGEGMALPDAMRQGRNRMALIAKTQVADAGRAATTVEMVADKGWSSYVRVLNLPSCGRCIVLAGREYRWSEGFLRHPGCDCEHILLRHDAPERELILSPRDAFETMTKEQQDKALNKAGAEAVRLGADVGQVVNARRGMQVAGERLVTSEGTTKRGLAGRRMGPASGRKSAVRPMPDQIIEDANGDRDEAIRLLYRFGYITRVPAEVSRIPRQR
jgi:hypothetical protein